MIEVVFPGRPYPWPRHRMGKGRQFKTTKQKKRMDDLALMIKMAAKGRTLTGPVTLHVSFDYKNAQTEILVGPISIPTKNYREKRGDIDNLVKWVMESLQASGVVKDDAQVALLIAEKVE